MLKLLSLLIVALLLPVGFTRLKDKCPPPTTTPQTSSSTVTTPQTSDCTQDQDSNCASPTVMTPQKFCWTEWFDMDNPLGTGDWELLVDLRIMYPGKICAEPADIEARTYCGKTPVQAGDLVQKDKDTGFICLNKDQKDEKCNDYRVRFSCPPEYCAEEVCWTQWLDRDNPSGTGDWETLTDLHKNYPGKICKKPKFIEVVTLNGNIPASQTGQHFIIFNPTVGFACKNTPNQYCQDYKVRFGCCCD